MKALITWYSLSALFFFLVNPAIAQDICLIPQINRYCDNIDHLQNCERISRSGDALKLEYLKCSGKVCRITENVLGYRYMQIQVHYYLQDNKLIRVDADIESAAEDGSSLTVELRRIWFYGREAVCSEVSQKSFNPDSLFMMHPDPQRISSEIRSGALFQESTPGTDLVKKILNNLDLYLKESIMQGESIPANLASPFI